MNILSQVSQATSPSLEGLSRVLDPNTDNSIHSVNSIYANSQRFLQNFQTEREYFPSLLPRVLLPLITSCLHPLEKAFLEADYTEQEKRASAKDLFESKRENTFITLEELTLCGSDFRSTKSFSLDLSNTNITNEELENIAKRFPNIIAIRAVACYKLTDIPINLKQLKTLDVSRCPQLTDTAIIRISKNLKQLTTLNVSYCGLLTDAAVSSVSENLKQLTTLNVSECYGLTDTAIISVSENLKQLTALGVSYCDQLTDAAIISISENLKQLTTLDASYCRRLTDAAIISVSENLKQLTTLNVSRSYQQLTDAAIISISENLKQLKYLIVRFCPHLTDAAFANFDPSVIIIR